MILVRAPLRISLAGGGTDLPSFASIHGGRTLTLAIDKYVYVSISRRYSGPSLIHYRETETVTDVDSIKHPIIREVLRAHPLDFPFELHTTADIDANSGLGGSSAFTVALLAAVNGARGGNRQKARVLAEEAYRIEHDVLRAPIGKQDAYASAYGKLLECSYEPNGDVGARDRRSPKLEEFCASLLLFDTGLRRDANVSLAGQAANASTNVEAMRQQKDDVGWALDILRGSFPLADYGGLLRRHWARKQKLAAGISSERIDAMVAAAIDAGAWGAKLVGAGGGGFILACAAEEHHSAIEQAMGATRIRVSPAKNGVEILFHRRGQ